MRDDHGGIVIAVAAEQNGAKVCENVKLMKSKLLLLGLVFSLGSVTGLGQFSLSAGLTKDDGGFYILSLSASGSQDLISSLGATLTMEIWKTSIEEPDPTPVLSESYFAAEGLSWPALAGTGFDGGFSLGASFYGVFHEVNASMPDLYSAAAVEITPLIRNEGVDLLFSKGPQPLLSARIDIPSGLQKGTWRLVMPNTGSNHLLDATGARVVFDNVQSDYILRYDGSDLTLDVPEPSQFALVGGLALLGFAGWRRSRK